MSAAAAMLSLSVLPPGVSARLAVVPYVGSMSPTPLVDGVLTNDIDWETLTRHHGGDAAATKDRLRALLMAASSQNIVDALAAAPDARLIGSLHSVGMLHDGFVKNRDCSALHSMLSPLTRPARTRMDWFAGGHVVAYMYKGSVQVQAVLSALAQLDS